jgi:dTDP-4-dehydrorhamnose reductase
VTAVEKRGNDVVRLLVLGGSGMLGHRLWLTARNRHDTFATMRGSLPTAPWASCFDPAHVVEGVDADDVDELGRVLARVRPDVVVNAIGVIKQRPEGVDHVASITVNALFPHQLARLCASQGERLVHVSTDCVFSGTHGRYVEDDLPDARDLYGLSKCLGEVATPGAVTLRTSMVGRELVGCRSLVEWFIAQRGKRVQGYRQAIFSGVTTHELARTILAVIEHHPDLDGIWHVAAPPIDKDTLLRKLRDALSLPIEIDSSDDVVIDRSLDDHRFRQRTGIPTPSWDAMLMELAAASPWYEEVRWTAS